MSEKIINVLQTYRDNCFKAANELEKEHLAKQEEAREFANIISKYKKMENQASAWEKVWDVLIRGTGGVDNYFNGGLGSYGSCGVDCALNRISELLQTEAQYKLVMEEKSAAKSHPNECTASDSTLSKEEHSSGKQTDKHAHLASFISFTPMGTLGIR